MPDRTARSGSPHKTAVTLANFGVVGAATLLTAVLSLIAEDILTKSGGQTWFVPWRWLAAGILFSSLFLAVLLRGRANRATGTLFYVHALDEGMADWQEAALDEAGRRHLAVRSITRWVDIRSRTTPDGVIDLRDACAETGARLQDQINTDDPGTGYVIAPNALWPVALALGGSLPPVVNLRMLELHRDGATQMFGLSDDDPFPVRQDETELDSPTGENRVGIWLAFTPAAAHFSAERFAEFGVSHAHTVTFPGGPPGSQRPCPEWNEQQLRAMPRKLADILITIRKATSNRELVVVAMVPKTVALALGLLLSREAFRFFAGTHLMHYDQESGRYLPMRVRESQPSHSPIVEPDGSDA